MTLSAPRFQNPPTLWEVTTAALFLPLLYLATGLVATNHFVSGLQIIYLFIPGWWLTKRHGLQQRVWERSDALRIPLLIAATLVLSWGLNQLLPYWTRLFPLPTIYETMYKQMLAPSGALWWARQIFEIGFVAAISEEMFFRGFLLTSLARGGRRPFLAIILSGVIFSIYHVNPWYLPFYWILGMWMGAVYYFGGRLELAMLVHLTNNLYSLAAFHAQK